MSPECAGNRSIPNLAVSDLNSLPFAAGSFDIVTANMVAEHLSNPSLVLSEIARVLRDGGHFVFHTPNYGSLSTRIASRTPGCIKDAVVVLLENRHEEDIFNTHYQMNTRNAIEKHSARTGMEVLEVSFVSSSAMTVILGPLVVFELLWIRMLRRPRGEKMRSNIIGIMRKRALDATRDAPDKPCRQPDSGTTDR